MIFFFLLFLFIISNVGINIGFVIILRIVSVIIIRIERVIIGILICNGRLFRLEGFFCLYLLKFLVLIILVY